MKSHNYDESVSFFVFFFRGGGGGGEGGLFVCAKNRHEILVDGRISEENNYCSSQTTEETNYCSSQTISEDNSGNNEDKTK